MPIQTDSLNRKLYNLLNTRGYDPISRDSDVAQAGKVVPPEKADVFKFTFKQNGKEIDSAWATINQSTLTIYYDKDIGEKAGTKTPGLDYNDSWYGLLEFLKNWAQQRQLTFVLEPKEKLDSDMAQRTYMKSKDKLSEGYYPMGRTASYNNNIPTIKIVLQHTRQIQEGEQRYRNVARIFLENQQGERILAPTIKPGIAQIYARHLAEGGVPNDDRWNHIKSLCEEYSKMAGFVRAVRSNQFNESAQRLVEAGLNHYISLKETLSKMRGQRGYNSYFESWTPTLMENDGDETNNLNELFVQETLDPRIESVIPILSKLKLNLGEMKEVNELNEWSDSIIESSLDIDEGMGTKILAGAALIASLLGINQYQANQVYQNSPQLQALIRLHKEAKEAGDQTRVRDLERRIKLQKDRLDLDKGEVVGKDGKPIEVKEDGVAEGSEDYQEIFQMNTKQGKVGAVVQYKDKSFGFIYGTQLDPRKFDRAREAQQALNAHHNKQGVAENLDANQKRVGQLGPTEKVGKKGALGKLVGANESANIGKVSNSNKEDILNTPNKKMFEDEISEKWDKATKVSPEEKGKYEGKSKAELLKSYNKLKASGPHKKGSEEYGKMRELAFAIRAKSDWGKVKESVENNTSVFQEGKNDLDAMLKIINFKL